MLICGTFDEILANFCACELGGIPWFRALLKNWTWTDPFWIKDFFNGLVVGGDLFFNGPFLLGWKPVLGQIPLLWSPLEDWTATACTWMDFVAEIVSPVTVFFPNETDIYFVLSADTFLTLCILWLGFPLGAPWLSLYGWRTCLSDQCDVKVTHISLCSRLNSIVNF